MTSHVNREEVTARDISLYLRHPVFQLPYSLNNLVKLGKYVLLNMATYADILGRMWRYSQSSKHKIEIG